MKYNIVWLRRDLRLHDNAALFHALKSDLAVLPLFIFDIDILDQLQDKSDLRVSFIYNTLLALKQQLKAYQSDLLIMHGKPRAVFESILNAYDIQAVYTNHDYEPYAIQRDKFVGEYLSTRGVQFHTFKDQVIFETNEVLKDDGSPYTVYTPYSKKWKAKLNTFYLSSYPCETYSTNYAKLDLGQMISLNELGFESNLKALPTLETNVAVITNYHDTRDYPAILGTSRLSLHLRFGTISIRVLSRLALQYNEKYLNELIWRDFYQQILWHFPHVVASAFKPAYNKIVWRNNESEFKAWCEGRTGYPIVDAAMRELNETGWMHNRVRMIVASFLCKHLLIDWRWGEAYFAEKLIDFDLASNNGGWQWAAGSGVDAAPYFRIFNPTLQTQKFDKDLKYIKKWVPEFDTLNYPMPIVQHEVARDRCLKVYKEALSN